MLALSLSSVKEGTAHLFALPTFDCFHVMEAAISSYITFSMNGHSNAEFFQDEASTEESIPEYCPWQRLRPVCFFIIKGKQPPVSFHIVFYLSNKEASEFFSKPGLSLNQDIQGYTMRLSYRSRRLQLSTGTVFSRFSMDRNSEELWDGCISDWLKKIPLDFDRL